MTTNQRSVNAIARDKALAALATMSVQPTALVEFQSQGKVVVIGGDQAAQFESQAKQSEPQVRQSEPEAKQSEPGVQESRPLADLLLASDTIEPGNVIFPAVGTKIEIDGYLGAFTIALGKPGSAHYEVLQADLILDLGSEPLVRTPIKPAGYLLADSRDENSLRAALDQLKELVGTFEKPRYFDIDPNICAHGRSGQVGCTRCLDTCPAQAITSLGEAIEVDPYLCQGGGVCATVCPTGAIRYAYPGAGDTLDHIRQVLQHYRNEGGQNPVIAFIAASDYEHINEWPDTLLPISVEELASVGLDVWLAALAYGAAVLLIDAGSVPEGVDDALREQLSFARSLLDGMGYDASLIQYLVIHELPVDGLQDLNTPVMQDIALATFAGTSGKRETMFLAIDHLAAQASRLIEEKLDEEIALPKNAPFGRIHVDSSLCTLCMSCASVCPSSAVRAAGDLPRLLFVEANCTQCGLCQSACPEQAIQLYPRLLTDSKLRRTSIILNQESPFLCVSCRKPFATQSMINTIMAKLSGHSMFQSDRAKQRLQMCEDCRVVDVVQDADAMLATSGGRVQDEPARKH